MKPNIFFWQKDFTACGYYRSYLPARNLFLSKGDIIDVVASDDHRSAYNADVVITQRPYSDLSLAFLEEIKAAGKKIILDYDDDYLHLSPLNPAYSRIAPMARYVERMLEMADQIVVATEPLKEAYRRFNDNIVTIPNFIDEAVFDFQRSPGKDGLIIGWQGASSHFEDLKIIKNVVNKLTRDGRIKFILAGYNPGFFKNAVWRRGLPFDVQLSYFKLFLDFDIGLCPLSKTRFNESKSDIKFLEYGCQGIPVVASRVAPYNTIEDGETGFVARNLSDWERLLTRLMADEGERDRVGRNAKNYVASERTIQKNIWRWEEVIVRALG